MERKTSLIAVVGPTAAGKTGLGIDIAGRVGGEIISCDSMQIYRGLPIGTAQPDPEELARVPHHMLSFLDVWETFSVSDYVRRAKKIIAELESRGKMPVLVGGTGLYVRSLLQGFTFEENGRDEELRQRLLRQAETRGAQALYSELEQLDPVSAKEIHPNNVKRVIRALEYCYAAGEPFSAQAERSRRAEAPYRFLMLYLLYRDREKLYKRIDLRTDQMMEQGLLEEAKSFYDLCLTRGVPPTAAQAIGYKELFPYFEGKISLKTAVENIKQETRRYAKRQITWFSREPAAQPLYIDDYESRDELLAEAFRRCDGFCEGRSQ